MSNIAIILARGGSKRIPKKNIKKFLGKPIIKYSIDAALKSNCFKEVMVSTDDKRIAKVAQSYGAKIPFFRSAKASSDKASTAEALIEVLLEYKKRGKEFNYFCCIYPTAVFINPQKLRKAYRLLKETKTDSTYPVVRFSYPIQRAIKIVRGKIKRTQPKYKNYRSQDLMPTYHDAGQFYFMKTKVFLKKKTILTTNTVPIITPETEVQDIDHIEDWKLAEIKYKLLHEKK